MSFLHVSIHRRTACLKSSGQRERACSGKESKACFIIACSSIPFSSSAIHMICSRDSKAKNLHMAARPSPIFLPASVVKSTFGVAGDAASSAREEKGPAPHNNKPIIKNRLMPAMRAIYHKTVLRQ